MLRRLISTKGRFITVLGILLGGMIAHPSAQGSPLLFFYWAEQEQLHGQPEKHFGESVAIDGDIMVVGVPGAAAAANVFTRVGDTWTDAEALIASDGAFGDGFGHSVAIAGDTVVVSAWGAEVDGDQQGAAYVFTDVGAAWTVKTETAKLTASNGTAFDVFGVSVAISGNTVAVGAPVAAGNDQGAVYVFTEAAGDWTETAILTASNGAAGDYFGESVAIDGHTVVAGQALGERAAHVFTRSGGTWMETAQLLPPQGGAGFGNSVAIDGDRAVVGDPEFGAAYVFTRSGSSWVQDGLTPTPGASGGEFGASVAVDGDRVVVGDPGADTVYVFSLTETSWQRWTRPAPPHAGAGSSDFGRSVAIAGDTLVAGAPLANGNPLWQPGGAAYVFVWKPLFLSL